MTRESRRVRNNMTQVWEGCDCWHDGISGSESPGSTHIAKLEANLEATFACVRRPGHKWQLCSSCPKCGPSNIVLCWTMNWGSAWILDAFGGRCVTGTQVRAESQRRMNGGRRPVPTTLEKWSLTEGVKVRTEWICGKVNPGKLINDSEKTFHQYVDKSVQGPGFQPLSFCKTKLKTDLKENTIPWQHEINSNSSHRQMMWAKLAKTCISFQNNKNKYTSDY